MTNEEIVKALVERIGYSKAELKYLKNWPSDETTEDSKNYHEESIKTFEAMIELLRGKQPDAETGLMPCGCGGKAEIWLSDFTRFPYLITDYEVGCTECAMTTGWVRGKQENAMNVWNTAMGCIAAPMNPWIRTNDQPPTEMDACHNDWVLALAAYQSPDNPVRLPAADIVDWNFPVNCPELYPYWMPLPKLPEVEE